MLKSNNGITLTSLVITIIVLLILASVATVSGKGAIEYIKFNNAKAQFQTMQAQVNSWYEDYKVFCAEVDKDTTLTEGQKATKKDEWIGKDINISNLDATLVYNTLYDEEKGTSDATGYRYFSSDYIKNDLDIDGISYDFLINIQERTVLLYGGIIYQDKTYYSAENFGINNVEYEDITEEVSFRTKTENDYIVVYNIKFPNNMNISKYNVEYKMSGTDYWNVVTADMKYMYIYEEDGKTIEDNNAWKIYTSDYGVYNIKITTVSQKVGSKVTEVAVKNNKIKPENYGDVVHGYKNIDGNEETDDWQIFYNDGSNIWLISRDYVELDGETQNKINAQKGSSLYKYTYWWEEGFTTEGNPNKVIEDLLTNSNNWTYYVDSNFAQKAMGSPTIELFVNSYNEKYPNEERGKLIYKREEDLDFVGIEKDGVPNYSNNVNNEWISNLKTSDNLYIIESNFDNNEGGKAYAYWLSSPCKKYGNENTYTYMYIVSYNGKIYGRVYNNSNTYGFRPVVCLKSDVEINYNSENGIWNLE